MAGHSAVLLIGTPVLGSYTLTMLVEKQLPCGLSEGKPRYIGIASSSWPMAKKPSGSEEHVPDPEPELDVLALHNQGTPPRLTTGCRGTELGFLSSGGRRKWVRPKLGYLSDVGLPIFGLETHQHLEALVGRNSQLYVTSSPIREPKDVSATINISRFKKLRIQQERKST